jgi:ketosteroid isomerase-like protein
LRTAIVARFADDIRFIHNGGPELPYAKHRKGKAEASAFFGELAGSVDVTLFEVQRYLEQGDSVVAFGRSGCRSALRRARFSCGIVGQWPSNGFPDT